MRIDHHLNKMSTWVSLLNGIEKKEGKHGVGIRSGLIRLTNCQKYAAVQCVIKLPFVLEHEPNCFLRINVQVELLYVVVLGQTQVDSIKPHLLPNELKRIKQTFGLFLCFDPFEELVDVYLKVILATW
jgi:hypothetical protein